MASGSVIRPWVTSTVLIGLAFAFTNARAEYPDKPIKFIVNAAPGGAADNTARILAQALTERLGQPVIIENRPGASGIIGLDAVAKAKPDGYTLGNANLATYVVSALTAKKLPYNPEKDFTPIAKHWTQPNLLGVAPQLPVRNVAELVKYAKDRPNEVFYGSTGNGTALHVLGALFGNLSGAKISHVPYKSAPAAETDLATGQFQMMFSNITSMEPQVKAGRIRALAVTGPARSPLLPNVPTIREAGFPDLEMETWGGVIGPANMPPEVVAKLHKTINAILSDPAITKKHEQLGATVAPQSIDDFNKMIKSDHVRWGAVVKRNGIVLD